VLKFVIENDAETMMQPLIADGEAGCERNDAM